MIIYDKIIVYDPQFFFPFLMVHAEWAWCVSPKKASDLWFTPKDFHISPQPKKTQKKFRKKLTKKNVVQERVQQTERQPYNNGIRVDSYPRSRKDVRLVRRILCFEREARRAFRSIPYYIQPCDFMIILAPGCTHFDPPWERRGSLRRERLGNERVWYLQKGRTISECQKRVT